MKLIIKRDQEAKTGLLGGHKGMRFILSYRVELTPEEQALVTKYRMEYYILTFKTDKNGNKIAFHTIGSLMRGGTDTVDDVTILLNNEETLKNACQNFKTLLEVMATFGGEEVYEF
uniref:Uncharacterized protein n=1 Tax=candidate division WOR-3 bacterium TaxID=2052148 RepID=A0A7V3KND1_UNCW3